MKACVESLHLHLFLRSFYTSFYKRCLHTALAYLHNFVLRFTLPKAQRLLLEKGYINNMRVYYDYLCCSQHIAFAKYFQNFIEVDVEKWNQPFIVISAHGKFLLPYIFSLVFNLRLKREDQIEILIYRRSWMPVLEKRWIQYASFFGINLIFCYDITSYLRKIPSVLNNKGILIALPDLFFRDYSVKNAYSKYQKYIRFLQNTALKHHAEVLLLNSCISKAENKRQGNIIEKIESSHLSAHYVLDQHKKQFSFHANSWAFALHADFNL